MLVTNLNPTWRYQEVRKSTYEYTKEPLSLVSNCDGYRSHRLEDHEGILSGDISQSHGIFSSDHQKNRRDVSH